MGKEVTTLPAPLIDFICMVHYKIVYYAVLQKDINSYL